MKITRIERMKDDQSHGSSRWLIGFTDLTTLLLAFFILLFSATHVRNAAWEQASESMRSSFGGKAAITEVTGQSGAAKAEHSWDSVQREPGLDVKYLNSLVKQRLHSDPVLQNLQTYITVDAVLITLPADTAFEPGGDTLNGGGKEIARHLAAFLAQLPNAVQVIGHADPHLVNEQGRFGSNWHLSLARAVAVGHALYDSGYRNPVDIRGRGLADMESLPKNLPDDARNQMARRVDIRLSTMNPS